MTTQSTIAVLDGGAFAGAVFPGAVAEIKMHIAEVGWAGISVGALMAAFAANDKEKGSYRRFFLKEFCNRKDRRRSLAPPWRQPRRLLLGGLADQVPVMRKLVDNFELETKENLFPLAYDLRARRLYRFEGDFDLPVALAAACSPWPGVTRPVEHRDKNGTHYLVDALAYLLHKREFSDPTVIMRLFPVARRQPEADEHAVMIAHRETNVLRRPSPRDYERFVSHGALKTAKYLATIQFAE